MPKRERFIDCYNSWIEKEKMNDMGLCVALPKYLYNNTYFQLIKPTFDERDLNDREGVDGCIGV